MELVRRHDAHRLDVMEKESITRARWNILNKKSGILGITGKYTDRRDVQQQRSSECARQLAIDIEAYDQEYIGAYSPHWRADAIVFTAGVEKCPA